MSPTNYQLTALDSVVITFVDDDENGNPVTPDAGSVTVELSSATDTIVLDPSGTFATLTAGDVESTDNTVTVNASVNGVPSTPWVGTYDVIAAPVTPPPTATVLSGVFGTESAPASGTTAGGAETVTVFNHTTGNYEEVPA